MGDAPQEEEENAAEGRFPAGASFSNTFIGLNHHCPVRYGGVSTCDV